MASKTLNFLFDCLRKPAIHTHTHTHTHTHNQYLEVKKCFQSQDSNQRPPAYKAVALSLELVRNHVGKGQRTLFNSKQ